MIGQGREITLLPWNNGLGDLGRHELPFWGNQLEMKRVRHRETSAIIKPAMMTNAACLTGNAFKV
jgi:hypothetical protein